MARDVDYKGTDGCGEARFCDTMVCRGTDCHDYFETKQHKKWREVQKRKETREDKKRGVFVSGRD
ncbi:MAG: hypothetical protein PHE24_01710 [Patescibacteria group bacterium]|nr:hypothetical protein [Patescibacteria group bacterium]